MTGSPIPSRRRQLAVAHGVRRGRRGAGGRRGNQKAVWLIVAPSVRRVAYGSIAI